MWYPRGHWQTNDPGRLTHDMRTSRQLCVPALHSSTSAPQGSRRYQTSLPPVHNSRRVLAGLYRCAKLARNLGCYDYRVLSPLRKHRTRHVRPLCGNMTSSTKPEVYNISQRRQRTTEQKPQATCTKTGQVLPCGFWYMREDRQTDILVTIFCTPSWDEVTVIIEIGSHVSK